MDSKVLFIKISSVTIHTTGTLYDIPSIESFDVVRDAGMKNNYFLVWTGLRQSVPLKLCSNMPNFKVILDLENFKGP